MPEDAGSAKEMAATAAGTAQQPHRKLLVLGHNCVHSACNTHQQNAYTKATPLSHSAHQNLARPEVPGKRFP